MEPIKLTVYIEINDLTEEFSTFDELSNLVGYILRSGARELDVSIDYQIEPDEEQEANEHGTN